MIVAKFGGTSMKDASAMQASAQVIQNNSEIRVVVVSATSGTTNDLLAFEADKIRQRHLSLANEISLPTEEIEPILNRIDQLVAGMKLIGEQSAQSMDELQSQGELLSSKIFTQILKNQGLNAAWFDAREVIKTNSQFGNAQANIELISNQCREKLQPLLGNTVVVTQGFIGSRADGKTTTLGRGGSDYSASLFAEGLEAQAVQIWTDVAGVYSVDPRIVPDAQVILELSFDESVELSNYGAKVLHPSSLWPAIRKNIPVFVGHSQHPERGGTRILKQIESRPTVRALALRRNQELLTLSSLDMIQTAGFLEKIFSIFGKYQLSVDLVTTGQASIAITLDQPKSLTTECIEELESFCVVKRESNLSLISIIGNKLADQAGFIGMLFSKLSDFPIRMICHGGAPHSMSFLMQAGHEEQILQFLHQEFVEA